MYAGDDLHGDDVTSGVLVDEPPVGCQLCTGCGFACSKTDDGLCWDCSHELGGEAG